MTTHVLIAAPYFQNVGLQDAIVGSLGTLVPLKQRHVKPTQPLWVLDTTNVTYLQGLMREASHRMRHFQHGDFSG